MCDCVRPGIGWTSNAPRPHASPSGNALPHGPHQNPSGGRRGSLGRVLAPSRTSSRRGRAWLVRLGAMSGGGIAHCGLSHREQACAFRILHGCVFTGVFKGYLQMTVAADALFCLHTSCGAPRFDTLSHTFLTCPLAQQLWRWLGDVWSALTDAPLPVCAAVLMADDRRMRCPAPDAADLWIRLRILGLATLWRAHFFFFFFFFGKWVLT